MKKKIELILGNKRRMKSRKKRRGSEHQRQAVHKNKKSHGDSNRGRMEVVLQYAAQDLAVAPLHGTRDGTCTCDDPDCRQLGHHPRTKRGTEDATTARSLIGERWAKWPQAEDGVEGPESRNLLASRNKERIGGHRERRDAALCNGCEWDIDLAIGAGPQDMNLHTFGDTHT